MASKGDVDKKDDLGGPEGQEPVNPAATCPAKRVSATRSTHVITNCSSAWNLVLTLFRLLSWGKSHSRGYRNKTILGAILVGVPLYFVVGGPDKP